MTTRILTIIFSFIITLGFAGNPDRQGESGAAELLLNPWAKSAGFHSMNTSFIGGIEAFRVNPAGIGRFDSNRELAVANTRLYEGADIQLNALGYVQKTKNGNGAFGVSMSNVNFGDIEITTVANPAGTGGTFSPSFFNIGLGYAHTYENKISVGILFRGISENLTALSAFGGAIDAGVQYVSGANDEFKLGISIRNVGTRMSFGGNSLGQDVDIPNEGATYILNLENTAKSFELPSLLNIGASYDLFFTRFDDGDGNVMVDRSMYLTIFGNFTSNAFSRDQIGGGVEFTYKNIFQLRGAYKYEIDSGGTGDGRENVYTGLAGGASFMFNMRKAKDGEKAIDIPRASLDYAYRTTNPFRGTHNIGLKIML